MKEEEIQSSELNKQTTVPEEDVEMALAPTNSLPSAARVVAHRGSNGSYQVDVVAQSIAGTSVESQWNSVAGTGHYTAHPYISLRFDTSLPHRTNYTLTTLAGVVVISGQTPTVNVDHLNFILRPPSSGQQVFTGSDTYNLSLSTRAGAVSTSIDSTGGGLVIIANVDENEEFYEVDPTRTVKEVAKEEYRHLEG